jgi:RecB family endonuclease NucS
MINEDDMENAIISDPEKYIGEKGLKLISRQFRIGKYIFDLLFEDRHGGKLIVELQKGTLDREHTYKILDYYDEYREAYP